MALRVGLGPNPNLKGCILGDSMGLGKTMQVIAVMHILLRQNPFKREALLKKVLIVCPVSLCKNWFNEIIHWLDEKRLYPLIANKDDENVTQTIKKFVKDQYRCLICSYETVTQYCDLFSEPIELMVCDEGHRLKNPSIKQYKSLQRINCQRRILISGTPIQNSLTELYALVNFVNPDLFRNEKSFKKVYGDPITEGMRKNAPDSVKELSKERSKELMSILNTFMIRRTQKILEEFLPQRNEFIIYLKPTEKQIAMYNQSLEIFRKQSYDANTNNYGEIFSILNVLRKILNHPKLIHNSDSAITDELKRNPGAEQSESSPLLDSVKFIFLDKILSKMTKGEKIILVSYYTQTLDVLEQHLEQRGLKHSRLDGSMSMKKRHSEVAKFNDVFSGFNVFLLGAKAGGTGLNLVAANRMVLFDLDWNPSNDAQVMGRVYRKGQTKPVYIYRLVCSGTVEEKIMERQISKVDLSNMVMDDKDSSIKFTKDELRTLFLPFQPKLSPFVLRKKNFKAELLKKMPDFDESYKAIIEYVIIDEEKELEIFREDMQDNVDEEAEDDSVVLIRRPEEDTDNLRCIEEEQQSETLHVPTKTNTNAVSLSGEQFRNSISKKPLTFNLPFARPNKPDHLQKPPFSTLSIIIQPETESQRSSKTIAMQSEHREDDNSDESKPPNEESNPQPQTSKGILLSQSANQKNVTESKLTESHLKKTTVKELTNSPDYEALLADAKMCFY